MRPPEVGPVQAEGLNGTSAWGKQLWWIWDERGKRGRCERVKIHVHFPAGPAVARPLGAGRGGASSVQLPSTATSCHAEGAPLLFRHGEEVAAKPDQPTPKVYPFSSGMGEMCERVWMGARAGGKQVAGCCV